MSAATKAILYGFWTSTCTWRVRAALLWKKVEFEERHVDIVKEQTQLRPEYQAINPAQRVPALVIDGHTLVESMAIIQYLEDTRPTPSLTPNQPLPRARMREICETVVSGMQPFQNISLKAHFDTEEKFTEFAKFWTERGLQTLEVLLKNSNGRYCVGDQLTMADLCLVPHLYSAETRHKLDLSKFPASHQLYKSLLKEKVLQDSHPVIVRAKLRTSM